MCEPFSTLSRLLIQFRARFPHGHLHVDLLLNDLTRDLVVVKVTALVDHVESGTGVGLISGPFSDLRTLVAHAKLDALADLGLVVAADPASSVDPFLAHLYASPTFAPAQEQEPSHTYLPAMTVANVHTYFCTVFSLTEAAEQAIQWEHFKAHCLGTALPDRALSFTHLVALHDALIEEAKRAALVAAHDTPCEVRP